MKHFPLCALFFVLFSGSIVAQSNNLTQDLDTTIYQLSDLDTLPEFYYKTGNSLEEKLNAYIKENQKWPAQVDGVFIVIVKFVIEKNGEVSHVEIIKEVSPDFDKEAIRLIQTMPIWKPGIKEDATVRTAMIFPVKWSILDN